MILSDDIMTALMTGGIAMEVRGNERRLEQCRRSFIR
jgi:hypothetical protein